MFPTPMIPNLIFSIVMAPLVFSVFLPREERYLQNTKKLRIFFAEIGKKHAQIGFLESKRVPFDIAGAKC